MARHKKDQRKIIMSETRQKLLQAAAQELAEQGFDRANVNRMAELAGYSVGTLYNYFPTKRELMYAFIDETAQTHVAYIQDRVLLVDAPDQKIENFFEAGFAFIENQNLLAKAIFTTLNSPDEDFKQRLFQAYQPLFILLAQDVISQGIQQGIFQQVQPQETASLIMLVYLGAGSQFNRQGKLWVTAPQVAGFVLNSLLKTRKE